MTNNNIPTLTITAYGDTFDIAPSIGRYNNDRLAISFDCDEGPYAKLTVNLPNDHLNEGEFFVKDYSENTLLALALIDAGWIKYTNREVQAGFSIAPVAKAAGPLLDYINSL